MKSTNAKILTIMLISLIVSSIHAQPIANYPLIDNLSDSTGNNTDVFLEGNPTAPTPPSMGVELCQNGIYLVNANGQNIQTPVLNNFDITDFEIEIEFKPQATVPASNPFQYTAILMGGKFSRWLGISINNQDQIGIKYNNSNTMFSASTVSINDVYHTARLRYVSGSTKLYLNNNPTPIIDTTLPPLEPFMNDYEFTTTDFNNGQPFNGCIRNLIVSSPAPIPVLFTDGFE